jgi:3-dehydroquinate dehydratase-2
VKRILLVEGPNLNLLGVREPSQYGTLTPSAIHGDLRSRFAGTCEIDTYQSNHEGALIDRIQACLSERPLGIVLNPGGFTHTSVALRDALAAISVPFIEVHLSNVHRREPFRQHSYFSDLAAGVIVGFGPLGYRLAVEALLELQA